MIQSSWNFGELTSLVTTCVTRLLIAASIGVFRASCALGGRPLRKSSSVVLLSICVRMASVVAVATLSRIA